MANLLAIGVGQMILIVLVGIIVLTLIMHYINRAFRIRYDLNLFWGGILMMIAIACICGGFFIFKAEKKIAYVLLAIAVILIIVTLIYDCKKCGVMGILALICQIVFSPGSLLILIEFFRGNHVTNYRNERYIRRKREEQEDNYRY